MKSNEVSKTFAFRESRGHVIDGDVRATKNVDRLSTSDDHVTKIAGHVGGNNDARKNEIWVEIEANRTKGWNTKNGKNITFFINYRSETNLVRRRRPLPGRSFERSCLKNRTLSMHRLNYNRFCYYLLLQHCTYRCVCDDVWCLVDFVACQFELVSSQTTLSSGQVRFRRPSLRRKLMAASGLPCLKSGCARLLAARTCGRHVTTIATVSQASAAGTSDALALTQILFCSAFQHLNQTKKNTV